MPRPAAAPLRQPTRIAAAAALALLCQAAAAQTVTEPQQVEIVGTSPLPGLGVSRDQLPYASQVVRRGAIDQAQTENLSDYMARRLPGVQANDIQGSPFQADLTFRGYRASGLLGSAQGLSVYLDGVRINEPFGDVVNWDLVPEFALGSLTIVPGANPAFGLNTLGGALAFTTADGFSQPGVQVELGYGSFARKRASATLGTDHGNGWASLVGVSAFDENGWRTGSPGHLAQAIAKVSRKDGATRWDATLLLGRSKLIGNGLTPAYTLAEDGTRTPDLLALGRQTVYTLPDPTKNTLAHLAVNLSQQLDDDTRAQALVYLRRTLRDGLTGDVADTLAPDAPNASLNTNHTRQTAWGLAASLARRAGAHQWQVGATLDANRVRYRQDEQEAQFNAARSAIALDEPPELASAVLGDATNLGLYATDTWHLGAATHLTATARFNHARVSNQLTTVDDATNAVTEQPRERFTYDSFNPALGLAHDLAPGLTLFGNLARNTRVPTVIELGCADPAQPCRLPAGLQSDPYLKQVRATSVEAGMRWRIAEGQRLELSLYRTDNRDDILFGSVSATGQLGYFQNFPRTRHQGLDAAWQARLGDWDLGVALSWLEATYQATGTLRMGERNVAITPGTRIAGIPRQQLKIGADWRFAPGWSAGADLQLVGRRGTQGNEDGLIADDSTVRQDLSVPGYGLLNLRAAWQLREGLELTLRMNNALDRHYASYGALGSTVFDARGAYTGDDVPAVFVAPGAPRSFFVGLKLSY